MKKSLIAAAISATTISMSVSVYSWGPWGDGDSNYNGYNNMNNRYNGRNYYPNRPYGYAPYGRPAPMVAPLAPPPSTPIPPQTAQKKRIQEIQQQTNMEADRKAYDERMKQWSVQAPAVRP